MSDVFVCPDCNYDNTYILDGFSSNKHWFVVCMQCGTMFMPINVYCFEFAFVDKKRNDRIYTSFYYFKKE